MKYELKKDGETKAAFEDASAYTPAQLRRMEADGYVLYIDGKRASPRGRKEKAN